jgi:uncharacterized protein (UPF0276 family)
MSARLGLGWRPQTAGVAAARDDLAFVEVVAESLSAHAPLPVGLSLLVDRAVTVIPHGIGLSLGGAERPPPERVDVLASAADRVGAPLVSEHLAFVRAGGVGVGHLLPVPRTRAMIDVLVEHIHVAQDRLPVPLAVEPIASVFEWPGAEMDEADFVAEVVERSGALLLLDLANVYVNSRNFDFDPCSYLDRVPLERLAYVHVAGGHVEAGVHHDTHARAVWPEVLALTSELVDRVPDACVMLERDDGFGRDADLQAELDALAAACAAPARPSGATTRVRSVRPERVPEPVASGVDRVALAEAQQLLVAAMLVGAPAPPGFDEGRVAIAQRSLRAKRRREVATLWPESTAALGPRYEVLFDAYASAQPPPPTGGPWADGAAFLRTLDRDQLRSPGAAAELRSAWKHAGRRRTSSWPGRSRARREVRG